MTRPTLSPYDANHPFPTWIGPVGLADTNSIITRSPCPRSRRPKSFSPRSTTSRSTSCNQVGARWKFTNPGPATSTFVTCGGNSPLKTSTIWVARSRGFLCATFADAMATFDDQSPCSRRAGRSSPTTSGAATPSLSRAERRASSSTTLIMITEPASHTGAYRCYRPPPATPAPVQLLVPLALPSRALFQFGRPDAERYPVTSRPRSSGDRASASGAVCAGSNPAEGAVEPASRQRICAGAEHEAGSPPLTAVAKRRNAVPRTRWAPRLARTTDWHSSPPADPSRRWVKGPWQSRHRWQVRSRVNRLGRPSNTSHGLRVPQVVGAAVLRHGAHEATRPRAVVAVKQRPLRRAVYLPPFGPFGDPRVLVELAVRAEAAGWDGVFLWDHVVGGAA